MREPDELPAARHADPTIRTGAGAWETAPPRPASYTSPPRRRAILWIALLLVVAGLGGGWFWWSGRNADRDRTAQAAPPAAIPVEIREARTGDVPIYLNGLGTVQAFNSVLVRTRVDGEIMKIAFTEGQAVKQGDVLALIDPRPYRAALDQALAKKAQDEASLTSIQADLERTRRLATQSFATPQQLDQQTAQSQALQAQIKADQAAVENATTQLDYTTIRSPLDGRTGIRLIDQGNIVRASDTTGIVEVVQLQPISVLFTAPEGQLPAISDAMQEGPVEVAAIGSDARTVLASGTLALINNQVDPATGTVRLKATFPNENNRLWPGLSVNTRLLVQTLKGVVTVPDGAIQRSQNGLFAYAVEGDKAVRRDLKVGPITKGVGVVEEGLKAGDKVVTAGQSRLTNGIRVEPARPAGAGPDHNRMAAGAGAPQAGSQTRPN